MLRLGEILSAVHAGNMLDICIHLKINGGSEKELGNRIMGRKKHIVCGPLVSASSLAPLPISNYCCLSCYQ